MPWGSPGKMPGGGGEHEGGQVTGAGGSHGLDRQLAELVEAAGVDVLVPMVS